MKKSRRLLCAASAFLMLLCGTGCDLAELFLDSDEIAAPAEEHKDQRYDVAAIREKIEKLTKIWNASDEEEQIKTLTEEIVTAVDEASAVCVRAEMQYYADWNNEDLRLLHEQTQQDYYEVYDMAQWVFSNGSRKSLFRELFTPYIVEEWVDYYLTVSLNRVAKSARTSSASSGRLLDEYYKAAYDPEIDADQANTTCAKLYLDTLDNYTLDEYLYDSYYRDYSAEDVSALYQEIVRVLVPLQKELTQYIQDNPKYEEIYQSDHFSAEPFEMIQKHAPEISASVTESIKKLLDEHLYTLGEGDDCYDGSYTVDIPNEQRALIYAYRSGTFSDFIGSVHEFGHFHADWRLTTPMLTQKSVVDVAEIQSQGMEMLFTHFYPDIFGDQADELEVMELYNIVDSVIAGFAVGEFEYEVMKNFDEADETFVLETYQRIMDECDLGLELYQVTHLYEQPGYYISYGVSALAALQIYTEMQESFASGVQLYEKIASVSSVDGEHMLRNALSICGFDDIFASETFDRNIKAVFDRVDSLKH